MFSRGVAPVVDDYCLQSGDFVGFQGTATGAIFNVGFTCCSSWSPTPWRRRRLAPVLATGPGIHMAIQMPICVRWASLHVVLIKFTNPYKLHRGGSCVYNCLRRVFISIMVESLPNHSSNDSSNRASKPRSYIEAIWRVNLAAASSLGELPIPIIDFIPTLATSRGR